MQKYLFEMRFGLAGNPKWTVPQGSENSRKLQRRNSCGRPESRRDVQVITRRVGERTLLAGRCLGTRGEIFIRVFETSRVRETLRGIRPGPAWASIFARPQQGSSSAQLGVNAEGDVVDVWRHQNIGFDTSVRDSL